MSPDKMKRTCITAICGSYDVLVDDTPNDGTEFICYTDNESLTSSKWKILPACDEFSGCWDGHVRNAKRHKLMIHEYADCDVSLWIDGNHRLLVRVLEIVHRFLQDYDIVLFKHPARDCAFDEMETCLQLELDIPSLMIEQLAKYEAEGFPRHFGLHAGSFILRRHTEKVKEFNELWWNEVCQHSKRDQLSLDYCLWKTGLRVGLFDEYWNSKLRYMVNHGEGR